MASRKPPQIVPLGQSTKYIKMCVVAGTGFGKTIFSATAPNALHLLSDREGTESAVYVGVGEGNQEWRINHFDTGDNSLQAAYDYLLGGGCNDFEWLIHDTLSSENDLAMERAMEIMRARGGKQDPFVPDKPQYQRSQQQFMEMYKMFHDLPINQMWLAWPRKIMITDPETGEEDEFWTAGIQNDYVAEKVLGMMKIIGYGHVRKSEDGKDVKRRMYFSQRGMYRGKDRYHALGNFKDDLDVPRMMRLIEAKRSGRAPTKRTGAIPRPVKKTASARRRTA